MTDSLYARDYLRWTDPRYTRAVELWERYYREADAFDERTLTGPRGRDGQRIPANARQHCLSMRHARELQLEIEQEATRAEIPKGTFEQARQAVMRGPRGPR